jgi:hypothetical protein
MAACDTFAGPRRGRDAALADSCELKITASSIVQWAPIVLACGAGETNLVIAQRMEVQPYRQKHGKLSTVLY